MLQNRIKKVKLALPDEAETGSAGEQPARNSSVNVNSRGLVSSGLRFYTIYITMPKKTQKIFSYSKNFQKSSRFKLFNVLLLRRDY
jgi:hypothetical protein